MPGYTLIFTALIIAVTAREGAAAQQPADRCSRITYSKPRAGARLYRLGRVEGQAVFAPASERRDTMAASGVCVALFGAGGRRLADVATGGGGEFRLADVAPGEYVLVASLDALHPAVVRVRVGGAGPGGEAGGAGLLLHMRSKEDGRRSFVSTFGNRALRGELLAMAARDQAARDELIRKGAARPDAATGARVAAVDARNTARMREIVRRYGWPGPELVGVDGAEAAFLVVQHAPHSFQKQMLPLVRAAYRAGKLSGPNYALITDRVLVERGEPQVYGTRARPFAEWEGGEPTLYPIRDEARVDRRRARLGLGPLSEYRELLKQIYFPRGVGPR